MHREQAGILLRTVVGNHDTVSQRGVQLRGALTRFKDVIGPVDQEETLSLNDGAALRMVKLLLLHEREGESV